MEFTYNKKRYKILQLAFIKIVTNNEVRKNENLAKIAIAIGLAHNAIEEIKN